MTPDLLTIREAAELVGVSKETLRRWDRAGKLVARRHPLNGYRLYERDRLLEATAPVAPRGPGARGRSKRPPRAAQAHPPEGSLGRAPRAVASATARAERWAHAVATEHLPLIAKHADRLRAAFSYWAANTADPAALTHATVVALALTRLVDTEGPGDLVALCDEALRLVERRPAQKGPLECARARIAMEQGARASAREHAEAALSDARAARDPSTEVAARCLLAEVLMKAGGERERRDAHLAAAEALAAQSDDPWLLALALGTRGNACFRQGDRDGARRSFERCVVLCQRVGNRLQEGVALGILGNLAQDDGDRDEALWFYGEAQKALAEAGARPAEGIFRGYLATALHEAGDFERARTEYQAAAKGLHEGGLARFEALVRASLGALEATSGNRRAAHKQLELAEGALPPATDDDLRTTLDLHRGHLDLLRARAGRGEGANPKRARYLLRALQRMERCHEEVLRRSDDARFARRLLERALASALEGALDCGGGALVVGATGTWFSWNGRSTDLGSRGAPRRLLWALVCARVEAPGRPVPNHELTRAGWPDERIAEASLMHRLRVAIATLRRVGFDDLLLTDAGGYLLDERVPIELAPRRFDPD